MAEESTAVARRSSIEAGAPPMALVPRNMDEVGRLSVMLARSGLTPSGLNTPEAIGVAIILGLEVGLSPMQAIQNIAVINGRPTVWGDAALALVRASHLLEDFREEPILENGAIAGYRCSARRVGERQIISHEFRLSDAKRAGLLNKRGPWQEYPQRMLQMRARSWVLRDGFPDVLRGLSVREEVIDIMPQSAGTPAPMQSAEIAPVEDAPDPLLQGNGAAKENAAARKDEQPRPEATAAGHLREKVPLGELPMDVLQREQLVAGFRTREMSESAIRGVLAKIGVACLDALTTDEAQRLLTDYGLPAAERASAGFSRMAAIDEIMDAVEDADLFEAVTGAMGALGLGDDWDKADDATLEKLLGKVRDLRAAKSE